MENNIYLKYLLEFYSAQLSGSEDKNSRPLPFSEITGLDEPSNFDDLVEIIESLKRGVR